MDYPFFESVSEILTIAILPNVILQSPKFLFDHLFSIAVISLSILVVRCFIDKTTILTSTSKIRRNSLRNDLIMKEGAIFYYKIHSYL